MFRDVVPLDLEYGNNLRDLEDRFFRLGTTGIDGVVLLQVQASFGKRSKKDQNSTVNKEDKLLGFTSSDAKSFAPVYAFA